MKQTVRVVVGGFVVFGLMTAACAKQEAPSAEETTAGEAVAEQQIPAPEPMIAVARLTAREGLEITGSVSFSQAEPDEPVMISAHIEGVPEGLHGFHVHEVGDCTAADFTSAGGHFNPMGVPHAGPSDAERHAGDLGNLEAGADGFVHLELSSDMLSVEEGPSSVVGRAVIVHEKADDLVSQPTGAAGSRLACGVVGREG